jgi:cytidine deaminase
MLEKQISLHLRVYPSTSELMDIDKALIDQARLALDKSYSPYSGFKVGAAARLANGHTISGANQENASYPVCVCAEVVMLGACASMHPSVTIEAVAITTHSGKPILSSPKAPCGQCRQTLLEFETRQKTPIQIIMHGTDDQVYVVDSIKELLPLFFSDTDL